jgi:hypothetical protein
MSMELWQRLKDLEKKVQEQSDRLKALQSLQIAAPQDSGTAQRARGDASPATEPAVAAVSNWGEETAKIALGAPLPKPGPALCQKCGKAPGYFFHVKYCKGNADLA